MRNAQAISLETSRELVSLLREAVTAAERYAAAVRKAGRLRSPADDLATLIDLDAREGETCEGITTTADEAMARLLSANESPQIGGDDTYERFRDDVRDATERVGVYCDADDWTESEPDY